MRRESALHVAGLAVWILLLPAGIARAQQHSTPPTEPAVEFWGAYGTSLTGHTGRLDSSYPPPFAGVPDSEGRAQQRLALERAGSRGLEAGLNVFPAPHAGVQVFLAHARTSWAGANTPYVVSLRYISRPPPSNEPVPVGIYASTRWPDTTGRLATWTIGAGPVVGWRSSSVGVTASGGVTWTRMDGQAAALGFTLYHLGGHSVLFPEQYRVRVTLGPTWTTRAFISGSFDVMLGGHVGATVALRAGLAADLDLPARVDAVVSSDAGLSPPAIAQIQTAMTPGPAQISARTLTLVVGVKIR